MPRMFIWSRPRSESPSLIFNYPSCGWKKPYTIVLGARRFSFWHFSGFHWIRWIMLPSSLPRQKWQCHTPLVDQFPWASHSGFPLSSISCSCLLLGICMCHSTCLNSFSSTSGLSFSSFKSQLKSSLLWEAVSDPQDSGSLWPLAFMPLSY